MDDYKNTKTINLTKKEIGGLGFLIGVNSDNKSYVTNIVIGGAAHECGQLQIHDEIISIDNKKFNLDNQLRDYLTDVSIGQTIEFLIKRPLHQNNNNMIESDVIRNDTDEEVDNTTISKTSPIKTMCSHDTKANDLQTLKPYKLKNLVDGTISVDTLHIDAGTTLCSFKKCVGSVYMPETAEPRPPGIVRSPEETKIQAIQFIKEYYISMKSENTESHMQRVKTICKEIDENGTYDMDEKELIFGARLAWRNASRCIGRIQWKKLQVFDCRHVMSTKEMFDCILHHMKYATNKGKIRSTITFFPHRKQNMHDFRIWNQQIILYAGYKQLDGSVIGDPANIELTEIATKLGWVGEGTHFDVLPLILQANGEQPDYFEIPKEYVLEVDIKHADYPELENLNLKWFALPAVSSIMLDCGGLEFTAAPFNGWYMASEIGARNFTDTSRYNLSKSVAKTLKINTSNNATLWRDKVMLELTYAVLQSFNDAGVTIVDHQTAAESFMKHYKEETKIRGGCPADWVWIVPPLSGSSTPVFHQEMLNYKLLPSYEYQTPPWKYFALKTLDESPRKKIAFKDIAKAVKFSAKMMVNALAKRHKVSILYGTETGKAQTFAQTLNALFLNAFDSKVKCMNDYHFPDIENDQCVIIVTSTSGNGEAPDNGLEFGTKLHSLLHPINNKQTRRGPLSTRIGDSKENNDVLANLRYSVFALGSRAYPQFCAYGHFVNNLFSKLGGEEIYPIGEGDELCGQEESFKSWAQKCFEATCATFCVNDIKVSEIAGFISKATSATDDTYRITKAVNKSTNINLCEALSTLHKRKIIANEIISVQNLQNQCSGRVTNLVRIKVCGDEMGYKPGDHLCVYPSNDSGDVAQLLKRVDAGGVDADELVNVEIEKQDQFSKAKRWENISTLPMPTTLQRIFTSYLDINSPPSMKMLKMFASHCLGEEDKQELLKLSEDSALYEDWKYQTYPNVLEVLENYPSIAIKVAVLINQLPVLKPRYYSISSSLALHPNEIHLTVALVRYVLNNGLSHSGVCSSWLHSLSKDTIVPSCIKRAPLFHLPLGNNDPVIMIGPGTGIAPFRSFWQEREYNVKAGLKNNIPEESVLFFGCRDSAVDDIYAKETEKAMEDGGLTKVYTAYSRDKNHPKKYVQHLLKEKLDEICELIVNRTAHVYVCGDVTMASDVFKTITEMIEEYMAFSHSEAQDHLQQLKENGRYHEDIFGVTLKIQEVTSRIRTAVKRKYQRQASMTR